MRTRTLTFLILCLLPAQSFGLGEVFETFNDTASLAMGGVNTATTEGILSNFYNPAALGKLRSSKNQINLFDLQGMGGQGFWGPFLSARTPSIPQMLDALQSSPNRYSYARLNALLSWATRGLSFGLWGSYEFAGESDGTTADIRALYDVGLTVGFARNFAGNIVKIGVSGKAIVRNAIIGQYAHADIAGESNINANTREGYAFGGNVGVLIRLPYHSIPTIGVVWKDPFNTYFTGSQFINSSSPGAPSPIQQSVNAGFAFHPRFTADAKAKISFELKQIQNPDVDFRKKWHVGMEIALWETHYTWVGLHQYNLSGGVGIHLPGGHFELGTYAENVGLGQLIANDRRYFFRYTVSFF